MGDDPVNALIRRAGQRSVVLMGSIPTSPTIFSQQEFYYG